MKPRPPRAVSRRVLHVTGHAHRTMREKGFTRAQVDAVFAAPESDQPSRSHPGQNRIVGGGLCLVGEWYRGTFTLITVYADRILTPPRPDQLETPEGRRYAERFKNGQGRG